MRFLETAVLTNSRDDKSSNALDSSELQIPLSARSRYIWRPNQDQYFQGVDDCVVGGSIFLHIYLGNEYNPGSYWTTESALSRYRQAFDHSCQASGVIYRASQGA